MYIPKAQAFPAITVSPKEKGSDSSLVPCLLSLSNSSPPSFCSRSSTIHQTQWKISSIAKLPSTKFLFSCLYLYTLSSKNLSISPKNSLPDLSSECRSLHPEASFPNRLVFSFTLANRHSP